MATEQLIQMLTQGVWDTLYVTVVSTLLAYVIGIPLGVLLYGTTSGSLFPNKAVNTVVGVIVNVLRSIPFIILLILTQPVAKAMVGSKLGNKAFIVYLVIAAAPFVARMIESSLREVDGGVIEAAQSMGSNNFQIICKVLLPEALPSLINGATICMTTILAYTAMAGSAGGDGLGKLAISYGLNRRDYTVMYTSSIALVIIVQIIQVIGNALTRLSDHKRR